MKTIQEIELEELEKASWNFDVSLPKAPGASALNDIQLYGDDAQQFFRTKYCLLVSKRGPIEQRITDLELILKQGAALLSALKNPKEKSNEQN